MLMVHLVRLRDAQLVRGVFGRDGAFDHVFDRLIDLGDELSRQRSTF
jgi:hypothetical protein